MNDTPNTAAPNDSPTPPALPPVPPSLPPAMPQGQQANTDAQNLNLLRIFYFVGSGVIAFFSCFAIIYIVMGILMMTGVMNDHGQPVPGAMGLMFTVLGSVGLLLGWALAVLMFFVGKYLGQRRHYVFCFAVGAVSCIWAPVGTVLGVFTIIILSRPSVKALFSQP